VRCRVGCHVIALLHTGIGAGVLVTVPVCLRFSVHCGDVCLVLGGGKTSPCTHAGRLIWLVLRLAFILTALG